MGDLLYTHWKFRFNRLLTSCQNPLALVTLSELHNLVRHVEICTGRVAKQRVKRRKSDVQESRLPNVIRGVHAPKSSPMSMHVNAFTVPSSLTLPMNST